MTRLTLAVSFALLAAAACGREPPGPHDGGADAGPDGGPTGPADDGGGITLANWNLEFFGDTTQNPADDTLQQRNVIAILGDAGFDIAGLEEVVDVSRFNAVLAALPGYDGVVSSDGNRVAGTSSCVSFGSACYGTFEQKLAVIFRTRAASLRSAQLILTGDSNVEYDFAYRPPLRVDLDVNLPDGGTDPLVVIVVHLKAYADSANWARRQASAAELKGYLDTVLPTAKVAVIGDWNDDLDVSIAGGATTPFQNFLDDPARYHFVTDVLTKDNVKTQTSGSPIDHQLVTNELLPQLHPGSVEVIHPELWGDPSYDAFGTYAYTTTTTDHWPVCSRWEP